MDEPVDHHEEPVVPVRIGKVCERCSRLLHYTKFERVLHEEEALRQGFRAAHTVKQEWKICRDCQRAVNCLPKPISQLKPNEIIEEAIKGRVRQQLVGGLIRRAEKRARQAQSDAQGKRWAQEWAQPWLYATDVVATELARMTALTKYNFNRHPHPTHRREILAFIDEHTHMLRALRGHFKLQIRSQAGREQRALIKKAQAQSQHTRANTHTGRPRGRPRTVYDQSRRDLVMMEDSTWRDYLHEGVWRVLDEKWAAIPTDVRVQRMRTTPLLVNTGHTLCLLGYEAPPTTREERDAANPRLQSMISTSVKP